MCVLKSKTAYEMRINGWSSYLCSSDLAGYCVEDVLRHVALDHLRHRHGIGQGIAEHAAEQTARFEDVGLRDRRVGLGQGVVVRRPQERQGSDQGSRADPGDALELRPVPMLRPALHEASAERPVVAAAGHGKETDRRQRTEEHTAGPQAL